MNERHVKSGWHALLAVMSVVEWRMSRTPFRRNLCLACAGWHIAAAIDDYNQADDEYAALKSEAPYVKRYMKEL